MTYIVYCHTSPSGKRYVGLTCKTVHARLVEHSHGKGYFGRAVRKYGIPAFKSEVLERMVTLAGACRAEQLWIARLGTLRPAGYNASPGGGACGLETRRRIASKLCGQKHTPERVEKMAARHRGRVQPAAEREKRAAKLRGKKRSPESIERYRAAAARREAAKRAAGIGLSEDHRARISAALRGKPKTPEHAAKVVASRRAGAGYTVSAETRAKISATLRARSRT